MAYSYKTLVRALTDVGIEDAADEAVLLLGQFANAPMGALMADRDRLYESEALDAAVVRRLERYPLQYILGSWWFFGALFEVNEHVLVPRPDTECLVERALASLPEGARFADLCTGSGCIAVSMLLQRPDLHATALELYPETLATAVRNAALNGVADRMTSVQADLLDGGVAALAAFAPFDAIVSNPPYIPTETVRGLSPEVLCEPFAALDGGADGLTFYRAILRDYPALLAPGGQILLEIGYDQADALRALCEAFLPGAAVSVLQDLGGNDRVVHITLPPPVA